MIYERNELLGHEMGKCLWINQFILLTLLFFSACTGCVSPVHSIFITSQAGSNDDDKVSALSWLVGSESSWL